MPAASSRAASRPGTSTVSYSKSHHYSAAFVHVASSIVLVVASELRPRASLELDVGPPLDVRLFAALAGFWSGALHVAQALGRGEPPAYFSAYRWVDYAVSASLMVPPVAAYAGQSDGSMMAAASVIMASVLGAGASAVERSISSGGSATLPFVACALIYAVAWAVAFAGAQAVSAGLRLTVAGLLVSHLACAGPAAARCFFPGYGLTPVQYARISAAVSAASKVTLHWTAYFVDPAGPASVFFLVALAMGDVAGAFVFVTDP